MRMEWPIRSIRTCKLTGTVTSIDFDGNSGYSFYMTDGTQGINVYRSSDLSNYTSPAMGDNIEVTGTIAQFRGLHEIISRQLEARVLQNNTVPAPMIVTTLDESTESELITFENVTLVDTSDWPTSATSRNVDFCHQRGRYADHADRLRRSHLSATPLLAASI